MTCVEFLDRYTEFRDGLIASPREARAFDRHLAQCAECRRYDGALRRGLSALQDAPPVEPSAGFRERLERRLAYEGTGGPALPGRIGIAAVLFIVVAIALIGFEGVRQPQITRAPALPRVPFPKPVAQAGVPFVSFQDPRSSVVISNPNPYGTALVEPVAAGR